MWYTWYYSLSSRDVGLMSTHWKPPSFYLAKKKKVYIVATELRVGLDKLYTKLDYHLGHNTTTIIILTLTSTQTQG